MRRHRKLTGLAGTAMVAAGLGLATPASALLGAGASQIDQAAQGLQSKPVYVDPRSGDVVSSDQASQLVQRIHSRRAAPLYVVVLPSSAAQAVGDNPVGVLKRVQSELRRPGVYAGFIGNEFRAFATAGSLPRGKAGTLASQSFYAQHADGVEPVLADFISRVGAARTGHRSSNTTPLPIILGGLALGVGGWLVLRRRARQRSRMP
jgi:hypothetical protein